MLHNIPMIWTVGHSTRREEEFLDLLVCHHIQAVADVRRFPGSRRYPCFAREALSISLPQRRIEYQWIPKLGGRRKPLPDSPNSGWRSESFRGYADHLGSPEFAQGLAELLALASRRRTALMCSEALWWRCHRALISDVLLSSGIKVKHILDAKHSSTHAYTSPARVLDGQLDYPSTMAAPTHLRASHVSVSERDPSDLWQAKHVEDLIDESGVESFPASDAPAVTPRRKPVSLQAVSSAPDTLDPQDRPFRR